MPYSSEKQRRFFHTATAAKAGITPATVREFDQASRGVSLPEALHKKKKMDHLKAMWHGGEIDDAEYLHHANELGERDELATAQDEDLETKNQIIDQARRATDETPPAEYPRDGKPKFNMAEGGEVMAPEIDPAKPYDLEEEDKRKMDQSVVLDHMDLKAAPDHKTADEHEEELESPDADKDPKRQMGEDEFEHMAHGGEAGKQPKLGTGKRFEHLEHELAHKGAKDPGAVAAFIGRKKYGEKKFSALSHHKHMADGGEVLDQANMAPLMKEGAIGTVKPGPDEAAMPNKKRNWHEFAMGMKKGKKGK
jgi:hypothetical protein